MNKILNRYQKVPIDEFVNHVPKCPLVSVCVQTYQHINYIKKCLDGILMQKTNFPFEILLGEDASIDGTREICIDYAKNNSNKIRLFLHHRENVIFINGNPTGRYNLFHNLINARGKYIALCEGDDYWIDPFKLQRQYDFLDKNPGYGLVHTDINKYFVNQNNFIYSANSSSNIYPASGDIYESLLTYNYTIQTCTMFFRKDLINDAISDNKFFLFPAADLILQEHISNKSKVKYFDFSTAVRTHIRELPFHKVDIRERIKFQMEMMKFREECIINNKSRFSKSSLNRFKIKKNRIILRNNFFTQNHQEINKYYKKLRDLNAQKISDFLFYFISKSPIISSIIIKKRNYHIYFEKLRYKINGFSDIILKYLSQLVSIY